jgi:Tfp pilus assembly pilus retraction ATPase PilT
MALSDLDILPTNQWHQIRDIYIPLVSPQGGEDGYAVNENLIDETIAYVGGIEPKLLYNPDEPASIRRLIEIFMKSDARMQRVDKFRIEHDGFAFRAQRVITDEGPVLELRSLPSTVPKLRQLNMPASCRSLLMDSDLLHGGLFLICATNGQGKTTTCSAAVASRLEAYAGLANCVEDPPELPLKGWHGKGRCFQIPADVDDTEAPGSGYAKALLKTLRFFPSMPNGGTILFVGEIRDPRTAAEALLASANGHLVLATIHAQNVTAALMSTCPHSPCSRCSQRRSVA